MSDIVQLFTGDEAVSRANFNQKFAEINAKAAPATAGVTQTERDTWNGKVDGTTLANHVQNNDIHVTLADKTKWNATGTNWVAANVLPTSYPGVEFKLDIPNFVFTEGCSVTFKSPFKLVEDSNSLISVNGVNFALRSSLGKIVSPNAWAANATITVILSTQKFPLYAPGDERDGTAFYAGNITPRVYVQPTAPPHPNVDDLWFW